MTNVENKSSEAHIERSIIGQSLLGAHDSLAWVAASTSQSWTSIEREHIASVIRGLASNPGVPVDSGSVVAVLASSEEGKLAVSELTNCVRSVASTKNAEYWCRLGSQKQAARAYRDLGRKLQEAEDGHEFILHESVKSIASVSAQARVYSIDDLVIQRQQELELGPEDSVARTGVDPVDRCLRGFLPGRLYVVAGRPGHGKTTFMTQCALRSAEHGCPVLIIELEMDESELIDTLVLQASSGKIHSARLESNILTDLETQVWHATSSRLARLPISIDVTPGQTLEGAVAVIRKYYASGQCGAVFLDYVQLLRAAGNWRNRRQEEVSHVSRTLQQLSKELRVPIIIGAQLNRYWSGDVAPRPQSHNLRESGSLEQDAHAVILLHHPYKYSQEHPNGEAEVIIGKNRRGPEGVYKVNFNPENLCFS